MLNGPHLFPDDQAFEAWSLIGEPKGTPCHGVRPSFRGPQIGGSLKMGLLSPIWLGPAIRSFRGARYAYSFCTDFVGRVCEALDGTRKGRIAKGCFRGLGIGFLPKTCSPELLRKYAVCFEAVYSGHKLTQIDVHFIHIDTNCKNNAQSLKICFFGVAELRRLAGSRCMDLLQCSDGIQT